MNFLLTSTEIFVLGLLDFGEEQGVSWELLAEDFEFVGPLEVVFGVLVVEEDLFVGSDGALFEFGVFQADAALRLSVAHELVG